MTYTFDEVSSMITGNAIVKNPNAQITTLLTDSRKVVFPEMSLMFAIKGPQHDGHRFVAEAYEKGVTNFIVENDSIVKDLPEANFIEVGNSISALQELASLHRQKFNVPVIGITGSNGKTIIKEWLHDLLSQDFKVIRSPKSYNSQIGVPLSVWQMDPEHELGIFEAGISLPGEMEKIEEVIKPKIGVFTNIGPAHDEGFTNTSQKINEKLKLFRNAEVLVYCRDQEIVKTHVESFSGQFNVSAFSWGFCEGADVRILFCEKVENHTNIKGIYNEKTFDFNISFLDRASIENAIHCIAIMFLLDYKEETIKDRLSLLHNLPLRLVLKQAQNNSVLIYDCYNSDLNSLHIALDFLDQQSRHKLKTVILSDILQSGRRSEELYAEIGKLFMARNIKRFIGIGPEISKYAGNLELSAGIKSSFYTSTDEFLKQMHNYVCKEEVILLKGARKFEFEKIGKILEAKAHDTVLEIYLNAIANNLTTYKKRLKPGVKLMVMVKAFAYGSGSDEIANLLQFHRVDYLAVAYADEGIELRKAGVKIPVMVMNPEVNNLENLIKNQLEPEIYSFRILENFIRSIESYEDVREYHSIHIKLDTGMHRLGFEEKDIEDLLAKIKKHPKIRVKTIFSHLAGSERVEHDEFSREQFSKFETMSQEMIRQLGYSIDRHILNSAGIIRFPDNQYEMVRLGIGLYGVDPSGNIQQLLEPISALKSIISQIKLIPGNASIGYDRKQITRRVTKVGTVAIGYADGYSRHYSNGIGKMMIGNQLVPVIGNICMDMTMVDLTDVENVNEGDEIIVFSKELPIQKLAEWDHTIPYEILSRIPHRVKRVYVEE